MRADRQVNDDRAAIDLEATKQTVPARRPLRQG
jgi:hypothetical protein